MEACRNHWFHRRLHLESLGERNNEQNQIPLLGRNNWTRGRKRAKEMQEIMDEIKLAFDNFCADAEAIIEDAKKKKGKN